jgi:oligogalacturonide lyase
MILLFTGHKRYAAEPSTTMSPDGTMIQIQSAMLFADNCSMNIYIIPVPEKWLKRTYK